MDLHSKKPIKLGDYQPLRAAFDEYCAESFVSLVPFRDGSGVLPPYPLPPSGTDAHDKADEVRREGEDH